ncbi:hypothetical protein R6Q59_022584 [Mikania micrantha]
MYILMLSSLVIFHTLYVSWVTHMMHKELVETYFKNARKMLTSVGEVHLRHRDDPPYDRWNVVLLAAKAGLALKEKVGFNQSDYPGYYNIRGGDINTNDTFPIICAYTYKFVKDRS